MPPFRNLSAQRGWRLALVLLLSGVVLTPRQAHCQSPSMSVTVQAHSATTVKPAVRIRAAQTPAANDYTPHVPRRALLYQRAAYTLGLFGLAWHVLGLWLLLRTGLSARLRDRVYRLTRRAPLPIRHAPPFRAFFVFGLAYLLLMRLWALPFGLADLALEHRFGFSRQSLGGFFGDETRDLLLTSLLIPLAWGVYRLHARSPRRWWLMAWALAIPFICAQMIVEPVVIAPLYNRFTPLPPGLLNQKLLALAARAGITGAHVFVADTGRRTSHVNAYVTGIGPATRIVIEDTALQTLPEDQLLAMMGHEMGHYAEGHIWVELASGMLGSGLLLGLLAYALPRLAYRNRRRFRLRGAQDLSALPLASLTLFVLLQIQLPLANGLSRYLEHRADAYGLRLTHLNYASARLYVGFAERDYSDPDPPRLLHFWFGTHPTLKERIDYALHFTD